VPAADAPAGLARLGIGRLGLLAATAPLVVFLLLPLGVLLARTAAGGRLAEYLTTPLVAEALRLSLFSTAATVALTVLLGTPLAYALARYRFPGHDVVDTLLDLPIVLPPAVAGLALLMTLGRRGLLGPTLEAASVEIGFTTTAVVLAQLFIAAPLYVKAAKPGIAAVDPALEQAAAIAGASSWQTFRYVTVPLALPALVGGVVLAWARALGEFGATIMFAGNFLGTTQTMPLAIYAALDRDLGAALVLASILVLVSFLVLLVVKLVARPAAARP
jgi:molybdate transport system permease protein